MRLASATGLLVLASLAAACKSAPSAPDDTGIKNRLAALGVEGRTYVHDLGATSSILVHAIHQAGDDFLVEDVHGHLTYVDGATLNVRWEFYGLPGTFSHVPSFTPSAVIGMSKGYLYVLTRSAGVPEPQPRWLELIPSAAPVATDSTAYIPTYPTPAGNRTVYAVSLGSGYLGWGARTSGDVVSNMAKGGPGAGDTVYFGTTTGALVAYPADLASERDPEVAWATHAQSGIRFDLVVDGDDLGVVTEDGRLICYDRVTGNPRWEAYPDAGQYGESPAQFSSEMAFYRRAGALYAFDRATGAPKWKVPHATRYLAQRGNRVIVAADGGMVYSVDATTGEVGHRCRFPGVTILPQPQKDATVTAVTDRGLCVAVEFGW